MARESGVRILSEASALRRNLQIDPNSQRKRKTFTIVFRTISKAVPEADLCVMKNERRDHPDVSLG